MANDLSVKLEGEARAHLGRVARHFADSQKWTLARMVHSQTVEEWKRIIEAMSPDQRCGGNGDSQPEPPEPQRTQRTLRGAGKTAARLDSESSVSSVALSDESDCQSGASVPREGACQ